VNAHRGAGVPVDLALFGVRPGSFLDPVPAGGSRLGGPDGLVVSSTLLDAGLHLADTITIDRLGVKLTVATSPGYSAETSTLTLIQVFLYAISALVVGAFSTVWTIHRRHELAVLRAIGASRAYLLRDGLAQALLILLAGCAIGVLTGVGVGALVSGGDVPFALETPAVLTAAGLLITLGLLFPRDGRQRRASCAVQAGASASSNAVIRRRPARRQHQLVGQAAVPAGDGLAAYV
jgi:hypothetical protein